MLFHALCLIDGVNTENNIQVLFHAFYLIFLYKQFIIVANSKHGKCFINIVSYFVLKIIIISRKRCFAKLFNSLRCCCYYYFLIFFCVPSAASLNVWKVFLIRTREMSFFFGVILSTKKKWNNWDTESI